MRSDFLSKLHVDVGGPTTGGDMSSQPASELFFISADWKAEYGANVTPVTLQIGERDRLDTAECLSEIWVRIFFDQCAKFGGSN